jgi:hypothetical protein
VPTGGATRDVSITLGDLTPHDRFAPSYTFIDDGFHPYTDVSPVINEARDRFGALDVHGFAQPVSSHVDTEAPPRQAAETPNDREGCAH